MFFQWGAKIELSRDVHVEGMLSGSHFTTSDYISEDVVVVLN